MLLNFVFVTETELDNTGMFHLLSSFYSKTFSGFGAALPERRLGVCQALRGG